jgi:hypothetical protein
MRFNKQKAENREEEWGKQVYAITSFSEGANIELAVILCSTGSVFR